MVSGSTILITGGTGAFGQAMTKFLLTQYSDIVIRILSRDEYRQSQMQETFANDSRLRFLLGDVRDMNRLRLALRGVDTVIHAAALKRIEQCEYNPYECVQTNVVGTRNVAQACIEANVQTAVFLSTDKAPAAVNCYGRSKALAESLWIQSNAYSPKGTRFVCTRYGNVMGSRGSVLEIYRCCLDQGKPLPVTDMGMTRFWMSMDEAVALVHKATCHPLRGALYVPKLPAFSLADLVRAVTGIEHGTHVFVGSGHAVEIGLRPGERLHETLVLPDEQTRWHYDEELELYLVAPAFSSWVNELPAFAEDAHPPYTSETWPCRLNAADIRAKLRAIRFF